MPIFTFANAFLNALATPAAPLTGTWYGQLMGPGFAFDPDAMDTIAAVTSGEIALVPGYSAGGKAITLSNATAGNIVTVTIAQVQWSASVANVQGMLIYYRPLGSISSQWLVMGYNNFGTLQNHQGGIFRIESGFFQAAKSGSLSHTLPTATITAIINKQLIFSTATVYAMILTASYTPNLAHSFRSSLTAFEVSGGGYTAGGVACPVTVTRDDTANKIIVKFNGPIFPACTISGQYVAFYVRAGGPASEDQVILVMNWGAPYSSGGNALPVGDNTIEIVASYPA